MSRDTLGIVGGPIFHEHQLLHEHCAIFTEGVCTAVVSESNAPITTRTLDLKTKILSQGYADIQVNGGGGILLNNDPSINALNTMQVAHRGLGVTRLLPTLITATPEITESAIDATINAIKSGMSTIAGLHLEGPHLSLKKKGAHNASLIRPMKQSDVDTLLHAAAHLPVLKVTLAPENVSLEQVKTLHQAGVRLALGHTNAGYDECLQYHAAGVSCVTHLFNAMSSLGSREPGLVGAALDTQGLSMGLIADGIHVNSASIRIALNSMGGMHRVYLVSDAMAVAGTSETSFELDGRRIRRRKGRLTLDDGTLAGADLDLTTAVRHLVEEAGVDLADALGSAVTVPRTVLGMDANPASLLGVSIEDMISIDASLTSANCIVAA